VGRPVADLRLEETAVHRHHLMSPGLEKADFPPGPHGVLALVAVVVRIFCPQNLLHHDIGAANPAQGVLNPPALGPELLGVGEVPEVTAAAPSVIGAVGDGPLRGGGVNLYKLSQGVGLHDPDDFQLHPLSPEGLGHEDHGAVQTDDAIAFAGIALDQGSVDLAVFQVFHRPDA